MNRKKNDTLSTSEHRSEKHCPSGHSFVNNRCYLVSEYFLKRRVIRLRVTSPYQKPALSISARPSLHCSAHDAPPRYRFVAYNLEPDRQCRDRGAPPIAPP